MGLLDEVKSYGDQTSPRVSVCVCTYKRPRLLALLLDSLAGQSFPGPFQVIVVDNDAAGSAAQTVEATKECHPKLNIRYAIESQKGISFARNTAASLSAGDFLAWIDDDETAAKDWLMSLWMARSKSDTDGVFGPVIPVFAKNSPSWTGRSGMFDRLRHPTGQKSTHGRPEPETLLSKQLGSARQRCHSTRSLQIVGGRIMIFFPESKPAELGLSGVMKRKYLKLYRSNVSSLYGFWSASFVHQLFTGA